MTKRPRIVKFQKINVLNSKKDYTRWMAEQYTQGGDNVSEDARANPDVLAGKPEEAISDELYAIVVALDRGGEKVLTTRERKVFQLVVREGKTLEAVSKRFGCTPQAIDCSLRAGCVKLRKLALINMRC